MNNALSKGLFRYWDLPRSAVVNMKIGTKFLMIVAFVVSGYFAVGYTFHAMKLNQLDMDVLNEEVQR
ncbi:MAG: hypothetical protein HKP12_05790, partial [Gammaproteobacteria bacterium]|nr:hypothetical protein [Gammaproteobacteria bacterium]